MSSIEANYLDQTSEQFCELANAKAWADDIESRPSYTRSYELGEVALSYSIRKLRKLGVSPKVISQELNLSTDRLTELYITYKQTEAKVKVK